MRCRDTSKQGLRHFLWRWIYWIGSIRARNNSMPARPNMALLSVFSRLIWPSAWPLLHGSAMAFLTALMSRLNIRANCCRARMPEWRASSSQEPPRCSATIWMEAARHPDCRATPRRPGRFASPSQDRWRAPLSSTLAAGSSRDAPRVAIRKEGAPNGNGCPCTRDAGCRETADGRPCRPLPVDGFARS